MAINDDLKRSAVIVALNDMVKKGHFSICTIDSCARLLGIQVRGSEAYNLLNTMHCVDFAAMPANIKQVMPELIREVLNMEPFPLFKGEVIEANSPKQSIWNRLLN